MKRLLRYPAGEDLHKHSVQMYPDLGREGYVVPAATEGSQANLYGCTRICTEWQGVGIHSKFCLLKKSLLHLTYPRTFKQ